MGRGVALRTTVFVKKSCCNGYKNYSKEYLWLPDSSTKESHILHGYYGIYGMYTTDHEVKAV